MTFSGRREDHRLLTGAGRFSADWNLPGQVRAVFVRSDEAHGRLVGIDTATAQAAPGVLAVLTGADMAEEGFMRGPPRMPFKGRDRELIAPRKPALAVDRVRYVGEPVAVVIAETEAQAKEAAELVVVESEPLPAVVDVRQAVEPGAVAVHDEAPDNVAFTIDFGDAEATDAAFADAAHVVRVDLDSTRVVANPMEPRAALLRWDGDFLDIWCPSQGMPIIRAGMAAAVGIAPEAVRLHAEDVGGAFGVRGDTIPEYTALALAARRVGRPVKWVATRGECFVCDFHGRAVRMVAELALDDGGRFLGIRHDWLCDMGAHPSSAGPLISVLHSTAMTVGAYDMPAVSGTLRLGLTNQVPVTAYRGAGRPDMAYAVERLVDEAARQTGIDRIELRRKNMLPKDAFPYPVPTALDRSAYDSGDFARLMDTALEASDWAGFENRRAGAAKRGRLRGIGCALFIEPAGGVAPADEAAVSFDAAGGVLLHQVAQSSGQGHETVFPEIVARVLGLDPADISLRFPSADAPAQKGAGAFGSRSLMCQGSVLDAAAHGVVEKATALAAETLEVSEDDLDFGDGVFRVPGTNRHVALKDLAIAHPGALDTVAELPAARAYPSGMHVAEVEIDPETGVTTLVRYTAVDDCGTVVNETLVLGQIHGGIFQGLGQVLGEKCEVDANGQLLSGSFMDYFMPRADMAGAPDVHLRGVPSPTNALGAKGVGEAGTVGALPTAMNAISDALFRAGVRHFDMPATPARVWEALQAARQEA